MCRYSIGYLFVEKNKANSFSPIKPTVSHHFPPFKWQFLGYTPCIDKSIYVSLVPLETALCELWWKCQEISYRLATSHTESVLGTVIQIQFPFGGAFWQEKCMRISEYPSVSRPFDRWVISTTIENYRTILTKLKRQGEELCNS